MKPVSVRFQCFGPYMAEQFIDFEALQKNGLFLICGETGAGKTTILDAMCYALYGRSSGGLRGDLSVMRCKLAQKNDETLTEFVFDSNGKRYKFIRSLKYGRKKLNDTHNCLVLEGEEYVPIFENPKATFVNQKAQELIGLTYDQFRQVIILPQGQFEKLLVSDSAEKEKILVSLFHADRWQKIAEEIYRRVAERDGLLKQEKQAIAAKLKEYGCEKTEALKEKIVIQAEALTVLRAESTAAETLVKDCRERQEGALLENRAFEELAKLETREKCLEQEASRYDAEERLLQNADRVEKIRPQFAAFGDAKRDKLRAEGMLTAAEQAAEAAGKALASAETAWQNHDAARESHEKDKQRLTLLENARELYRSLKEKEKIAKERKKELSIAQTEKETAEQAFVLRDDAWQQAISRQNRAIGDYQQAQAVYLRGIGGILAQKLAEGEPCPVCGSREHPAPARTARDHISEAALEEKNAAMNEANDAVTAALRQRMEAEKQKNQADDALSRAVQTEALARADHENALARRIEGIATEKQLDTQIALLTGRIAAFVQAEGDLRQKRKEAGETETAARGRLEGAREELSAAQLRYGVQAAAWEKALADSGLETRENFLAADLETEEKQRRRTALIQFRTDLAQTRQQTEQQRLALEGRTAPDMAAIRTALAEAESAAKALTARVALAEKDLKTMEKDAKDLKIREEAYGREREKTDADLDFANRLRGRSGVSLQRYVLGVMLTSIASEANRLLANVYGGRYRLYRTDEISGSGHKGGLELEVYDSQNNQRRSVTTLSGGEKFLVALSLAIGLSTVVQAQGGGIRLEAMFIDEGFGSLDREAVNDALEVLQGIQRSSGIVGIISHVEALAEVIPTRLEITKGRQGSICRIQS